MIDKNELSKVLELSELAYKTGQTCFTDFLNPLISSEAIKISQKKKIAALAYGAYPEAERCIIGFSKNEELSVENFPISILKIDYNSKFSNISHRDILGSIIGLGIDRKVIGDIVILLDGAICLVKKDIASFIANNLTKIGRLGVHISVMPKDYVFFGLNNRVQKLIYCASLRLDVIISSVFGLSRSDSAKCLNQGKVFLNWIETKNSTHSIKEGDMITLRGFGRLQINEIKGQTKSGRLSILVTLF